VSEKKDFGIDGLLALNGDRYFIDDKGDLEVIFKIACTVILRIHYEKIDRWYC